MKICSSILPENAASIYNRGNIYFHALEKALLRPKRHESWRSGFKVVMFKNKLFQSIGPKLIKSKEVKTPDFQERRRSSTFCLC